MPLSPDARNQLLDDYVASGGSFWLQLFADAFDLDTIAGGTEVAIPRFQINRDGATTWEAAAAQKVLPLADALVTTSSPVASSLWGWKFMDASTAGTAILGDQFDQDTPAIALGGQVIIPRESLALYAPAKLSDLL